MAVAKNMTPSCLAVRAAREASGRSREAVAGAVGIRTRKLGRIELGYQQASVEVFAAIAATCGITMDDMLAQDAPETVLASDVVAGLVEREGATVVLEAVVGAMQDS